MNNYPNGPQQPYGQQPGGPYQSNPGYPPQGQPGPYTQYPGQPQFTPQGQTGYPPPGYPQGQPPMPQQPPVPQQPPKKKLGIFKIGCGVVAAVFVLIVIIGVANGSKGSSTAAPANPSNSSSGTTQQQQAPSQPQTWQTTHTYSGSGIKKTETITVPGDWKIQWSCDPTSFDGMNYNVIIAVYNSDGTVADPVAINDMCKSGNTSGETEERTAGNVYLDVNSEGSWTITIQELK